MTERTRPWHQTPYPAMPGGWEWLTGDRDWEGYGGAWYRWADDGSAVVIRFVNMWEASGERDCKRDGIPEFEASVSWVDLPNIPKPVLDAALSSCGYRFSHYQGVGVGRRFVIINDHDSELLVPSPILPITHSQLAANDEYQRRTRDILLEVLVSAGTFGQVWSKYGTRPIVLLKEARELAWAFIGDRAHFQDREVNKIGTTVAQAAAGNILGGLTDYAEQVMATGSAPDTGKNLMLKLFGADAQELANPKPPAQIVRPCPFSILPVVVEHWRPDGTCRCDDAEHRVFMIKKWKYRTKQFENIPLREQE